LPVVNSSAINYSYIATPHPTKMSVTGYVGSFVCVLVGVGDTKKSFT
jgi:hypothetical protein